MKLRIQIIGKALSIFSIHWTISIDVDSSIEVAAANWLAGKLDGVPVKSGVLSGKLSVSVIED